ncbi:MAG: response regulator [Deltaproteobacteria bacterium]|nr:response regulator [Deltaproteobacteria bacterium]
MQHLKERIRYLEEINRLTWDALETAAFLGDFQTSISNLHDASAILRETRLRVRSLIPFQTTAFFLVNETTAEFLLSECQPESSDPFIQDEVDFLICNGTFAWALREKRPVIVSSKNYQKRLVLHVMTTSSRIRGMFVGVLAQGEMDIPHISLSLLSIVMLNSANALESFELYSMIKQINVNLEKTVQDRTEQLAYQVKLENLIATISTTFINLAPAEIDTGINRALKSIGEFICADHGYVLLLSEDGTRVDNAHEWSAKGIEPRTSKYKGLALKDFPLLAEKIGNSENLHIPCVAELPVEIKADNNLLQLQGIQSLIVTPMVSSKSVIGLLGFYSVREKQSWSDDMVALFKIVGEMFVNALERKRVEEEKKDMQIQLFRAQKMQAVGTLAGGIAHNFNNILAVLQGNAQLISMDLDPTNPHYELVKEIEKQTKLGASLTRQLLGFAQGDVYEVQSVNINELVKQTSTTFGRTKKEIIIHRKFQEDLPFVESDTGQIEQVLMNLYINAVHAMPSGGNLYLETRTIGHEEVQETPFRIKPGNYVLISVTDTGVGMDKETRERIFEPFFTTRKMGRGTGLGLATVYGIIKAHGGYVEVESEKGRGTIFKLYLPASEKKVTKPIKVPDKVLKGTETILLVDDEEAVLTVGTKVLNKLGYTVLEAKSGHEAVEIYKINKNKIDLVILDMIMPDKGGGEAYDLLRAINPEVKVLLCSGYSIDGQAMAILDRGCNGFIQKPFDVKDLSGKIRAVIESEKDSL